jgi:hypothetical protein
MIYVFRRVCALIVFGYDLIAHSIAFVSRKLDMFVQEFDFLSRTLKC